KSAMGQENPAHTKVKDVVNFAKIFLKVRDMMNSAKVYPETSEEDVKPLMKLFFSMMMKSERGEPSEEEFGNENIGEEKGVWDEKEEITGEVVVSEIQSLIAFTKSKPNL
ncbi:MAG: hypothetical protein AABY15_00860, partial [Nanoarchaeota archaeon]